MEKEDPIMKRFRQYYHSDFTSESHNFLRQQCARYTPFTVNGLNQLPHVFMTAVSLAMDDYAEMKNKTLESDIKALREENTRLTTNFIEHENAAESPNDHLSYWQYQQFTRAAITKLKEELVTTEKALRDQLEACEQHNKILCEQKMESLKEIDRLKAEVLKEKFPNN